MASLGAEGSSFAKVDRVCGLVLCALALIAQGCRHTTGPATSAKPSAATLPTNASQPAGAVAAAKPLDSDGVSGHAPIENGVGGGGRNGGLVRRPKTLVRLSLMIEPLFARNVATLDDEATSALDQLINGMASNDRGWRCSISATADPREQHPPSLAAARGQAVRAYALARVAQWVTVAPIRIDQHRCTERSDACDQRNRRVIVECQG